MLAHYFLLWSSSFQNLLFCGSLMSCSSLAFGSFEDHCNESCISTWAFCANSSKGTKKTRGLQDSHIFVSSSVEEKRLHHCHCQMPYGSGNSMRSFQFCCYTSTNESKRPSKICLQVLFETLFICKRKHEHSPQ